MQKDKKQGKKKKQNENSGSYDLADTEVDCSKCRKRLYAPVEAFPRILAAVVHGEIGVLVCVCGHWNRVYPAPPCWVQIVLEMERRLSLN